MGYNFRDRRKRNRPTTHARRRGEPQPPNWVVWAVGVACALCVLVALWARLQGLW